MARFVVVALVVMSEAIEPLVAESTEAKKLVVVPFVPEKFCKVVEAKVMRPPQNCEAVVDVATR